VRGIALNMAFIRGAPVCRRQSDRSAGRLRPTADTCVGNPIAGAVALRVLGAPAISPLYVVAPQRDVTTRPGRGIIVRERERALAFRVAARQPSEATGRTGLAGPLTGHLTNGWSGRER
jgi:hypothetical protein